ncbi:MAG: hypothetical protein M3Z03_13740, partial [Actinomycetota bacterium]|nr:hypothetical protein [Actinomycetota bacterium]
MNRRKLWPLAVVLLAAAVPTSHADLPAGHTDTGAAAALRAAEATADTGSEAVPAPPVALAAASAGASPGVDGACDELDPKACLLPFPNDRFSIADPSTDTGRRVYLHQTSMPRNVAGLLADSAEWNRQDGFSPSSPILTFVPGLDLARTWGTDVDHLADLGRYQRRDAPIVVLDATTGQRHPIWSELDTHPATTDANRLLTLRPATQFVQGHRYIVALRRLRDGSGDRIPATRAFRAYRDGTAAPLGASPDFDARRPHLEQLFTELGDAGIGRSDLYLAWDFTVASQRNVSERVLRIRDDAFARLGDTDLADRVVEGRPPGFTVTEVQEMATGPTLREVRGTVQVPNYLTPQVEVDLELPAPIGNVGVAVADLLDELPAEVTDLVGEVTGVLPI